MEDASAQLRPEVHLRAIRGTAAGGGYELALATDHILLADDGSSTVALPELPLLAVLPGTGGLTRVTDKRKVRRDLADVFCTTEEGVKGERAVKWRLVDQVVPNSKFEQAREGRGAEKLAASPTGRPTPRASRSRRSSATSQPTRSPIRASKVEIDRERAARHAHHARARQAPPPASVEPWSRRAPASGRCGWPASSTMPSCICASTSPRSAC